MADVNITITVPDAWVGRTLSALNGMADKKIGIRFENAMREYEFESKTGEETNVEFAKRAFREMILQHIKAFEWSEDYQRFQSERDNIVEISENVPDELLT
jgi:hypothetical protein